MLGQRQPAGRQVGFGGPRIALFELVEDAVQHLLGIHSPLQVEFAQNRPAARIAVPPAGAVGQRVDLVQ